MVRTLRTFLQQTALIAAGSALFGFAIKAFIVPQGLLSGGLTGFALLVFYRWENLSLGLIYFFLNLPIFLLGWKFVGRRFVAYSLWGLVIYSTTLTFIDVEIPLSDPLLATLLGAALSGTGTAIILRSYGSSGGADTLCVILNKFFSLSLGAGAIFINAGLLVLSAFIFPIEKVLYAAVFTFFAGQFTNGVFQSLARRRTAIIISDHWQAVADSLVKADVRVTLLNGKGGFQGRDRTILYSVFTARAAAQVKRTVQEVDGTAFITIMAADDVTSVEVGNQPHW